MGILGFHHAALVTRDLDRILTFYCDVFGGKIVKEGTWGRGNTALNLRLGLSDSAAKTALVKVGKAYLEFFEFDTAASSNDTVALSADRLGIRHICFQVEDCNASFADLSARGVPFNAPPLKMPAGAIFTYGQDPDGNIIELLEVPAGADFPSNYEEEAAE